jgi:hypothetical protein
VERPVKVEPIRCLDCVADGVKPRTLALVAVMHDGAYGAIITGRRRHRREHEEAVLSYALGYGASPAPGDLKGPGERTEEILDPGESVTVACGRDHGSRPGRVTIDDAVIDSAIRRAGYPPDQLQRLDGQSARARARRLDPPPPLPDG